MSMITSGKELLRFFVLAAFLGGACLRGPGAGQPGYQGRAAGGI
jgi:hypothetical protein